MNIDSKEPNEFYCNNIRTIAPEDEPYREFLLWLSDKEFMTFEISKEIQVGIFDITATNLYIQWLKNKK